MSSSEGRQIFYLVIVANKCLDSQIRSGEPSVLCKLNLETTYDHVNSVLKINISKSKLVPVGAVDNIGGLARILGCRVSSLPMKYLGLSLGLRTRLSQYRMVLLKKWNVFWLVGKGFICQRVVDFD
jgi:hypothetical protein